MAGFVVNDKNEVLLVQEKWLHNLQVSHWKLPGGHSEPGQTSYDHLGQANNTSTFNEFVSECNVY